MNIVDFARLISKHLVLLILVPLLLGILVIVLTMNPSFEYSSKTLLYTGFATGTSIEMDKRFNYQATNTAFDNLINVINSRDTREEVAIRLLTQHLLLSEANSKYISKEHFKEFKNKIPDSLYRYVAKESNIDPNFNIENESSYYLFPKELDKKVYEKTVDNLTTLMESSNNNFVYELLNYDTDKHYSIKAVSQLSAQRVSNSDLIELRFTSNDPGICQQTLAIYNYVSIKNYKRVRENRSDAVVKYFEDELEKEKEKLNQAENKLLEFSKRTNIINFYEQSKAIANVKEDAEVNYKKLKADLAGTEASIDKLEEKLEIQDNVQEKSNAILEKKKKLGDINFKIALLKSEAQGDDKEQELLKLEKQAERLADEVDESVDKLYSYKNSKEGLPISDVLPEWMDNVVKAEKLKAKKDITNRQYKDFQEVFAKLAPAGANMKKLEREISVAEEGFLEVRRSLNQAKLKLQDSEMASNLKPVDIPYYPLNPNPTKRKILVIAASFVGGILTLAIIFIMEYFDDTLKNAKRASKKTGFTSLGIMVKTLLNPKGINLNFIQKRLIEIMTQNLYQYFDKQNLNDKPGIITVFSTQKNEGKTVIAGNIAKSLKSDDKKVLVLNHEVQQKQIIQNQKPQILNKILRYPDSRIDVNSPFLANPGDYLNSSEYTTYELDKQFYKAKTYKDILAGQTGIVDNPDFVIIELPAIIYHKYPTEIFKNADLNILVCRSNRVWSDADKAITKNLKEAYESKINIVVNGVNTEEAESIIGDLPKKRSNLRKKIKTILKFQFLSKNQI